MHRGGGRLLKACFLFFPLMSSTNSLLRMWYQIEYIDTYRTLFPGVPALTGMAVRWDGRDGAVTWPAAYSAHCEPFRQASSRRQSLTSTPITVLCLAFLLWSATESVKHTLLGNTSRAHDQIRHDFQFLLYVIVVSIPRRRVDGL